MPLNIIVTIAWFVALMIGIDNNKAARVQDEQTVTIESECHRGVNE